MQVYCNIKTMFKGWRELESFNKELTSTWSKNGSIFPMYDPETKEIFEVGFNSKHCTLVAYNPVSMKEFRKRTEALAQKIINEEMLKASQIVASRVADLYTELEFIELNR